MSRIQHETILGRTRTGKTTYAIHRAETLVKASAKQAIFFDTKASQAPPAGWVQITRQNTVGDLRAEPLAWYVPRRDHKEASQELQALVDVAIDTRGQVVLVVDEAQVWARSGQSDGPCQQVARLGAGPEYQVRGLFTAQRPADLAKAVLTQCERIVVFEVDEIWEGAYWSQKVPPEAWEQVQAATAGRYEYAVIEGGQVTGPHKISLSGHQAS